MEHTTLQIRKVRLLLSVFSLLLTTSTLVNANTVDGENSVNSSSHIQIADNNNITPPLQDLASLTITTASQAENVTPVPLPATAFLFGAALTGLVGISRRKHWLKVVRPAKDLNIMSLPFPELNQQQTLMLFQEWIFSKEAHQVCFVNVHTVVTSLSDPELRNINHHSLNLMDGLPLVWYAKMAHKSSRATRVCGPDLMLKCLDHGRNRDWKHFFLGGSEEVLTDLVSVMRTRYPGVEIVGWHSPAFRALTQVEENALIDMINTAKPDFLWVGLGAPKQEKWIAAHLDKIHVPVQLGVGAAFNFHSGHVKRAPNWMQKSGLEWLYRVSKETRLLKRYLQTNPVFLMHMLKDIVWLRVLMQKQS
jgi:N-acetylglucosaminyldiphosphoundecaprenol N-acetyl-beta-D-mannosaminyltransferase